MCWFSSKLNYNNLHYNNLLLDWHNDSCPQLSGRERLQNILPDCPLLKQCPWRQEQEELFSFWQCGNFIFLQLRLNKQFPHILSLDIITDSLSVENIRYHSKAQIWLYILNGYISAKQMLKQISSWTKDDCEATDWLAATGLNKS